MSLNWAGLHFLANTTYESECTSSSPERLSIDGRHIILPKVDKQAEIKDLLSFRGTPCDDLDFLFLDSEQELLIE